LVSRRAALSSIRYLFLSFLFLVVEPTHFIRHEVVDHFNLVLSRRNRQREAC